MIIAGATIVTKIVIAAISQEPLTMAAIIPAQNNKICNIANSNASSIQHLLQGTSQ